MHALKPRRLRRRGFVRGCRPLALEVELQGCVQLLHWPSDEQRRVERRCHRRQREAKEDSLARDRQTIQGAAGSTPTTTAVRSTQSETDKIAAYSGAGARPQEEETTRLERSFTSLLTGRVSCAATKCVCSLSLVLQGADTSARIHQIKS